MQSDAMDAQPQPTPPPAILHTPAELLDTARELLASNNQKLYRGAILEALASLESFIHLTIFPSLQQRFSAEFSKWLEEKTLMDFDSRLSILAPIATGIPVGKSSALWSRYKQTRQIRKGVVHGNRKVTKAEAEAVINTTAEWMAYLGSTIELENALLELKRWVESQSISPVQTSRDAEEVIVSFFAQSGAAKQWMHQQFRVEGKYWEVDVILEFETRKVLIETKFVTQKSRFLREKINEGLRQIDRLRHISGISQAGLVIFARWSKEDVPAAVEKHSNGEVLVVLISV
jgi:hypothetical protein